jgi:cellulase/cellobiase CelA1
VAVPVTLVVSSTAVSVPETGTRSFTVQLAAAPTTNVAVTVARTAGDTDISVAAGASLVFTPANWATPQTVTLAAAKDADSANGTATVSISAANAATRTVTATEVDNDLKTCAVLFDTSNDWGSGQVPSIKLSNLGTTPLSGWSLSFTESNAFTLTNSWSGTFAVNGRSITITPAPWNGTIAPNGSVDVGMQLTYSGAKPVPTGVSWAGQSCDITVK